MDNFAYSYTIRPERSFQERYRSWIFSYQLKFAVITNGRGLSLFGPGNFPGLHYYTIRQQCVRMCADKNFHLKILVRNIFAYFSDTDVERHYTLDLRYSEDK